jgi:hypothetical protein
MPHHQYVRIPTQVLFLVHCAKTVIIRCWPCTQVWIDVAHLHEPSATATAQVISFAAETDHLPEHVTELINSADPGFITAFGTQRVPETFSAEDNDVSKLNRPF